ncbi:tyrosine-protein phosphatase [Zhongshania sp. BJYM1]|uniref:tyrosine-protein phosphatase n=1 Tax=Zhongshania aquatica TaxID=2965069 RepID=UPI0022B5552C|nr:tyrosine-protein phosphatase [Marortus sp. BJYM1]
MEKKANINDSQHPPQANAIEPDLLGSAPNFRDLGGITTKSGLQLRHGVIYRSEVLDRLFSEDLKKFHAIGIGAVCDLRHGKERETRRIMWPRDTPPLSLGQPPSEGLEAVQSNTLLKRLNADDFEAEEAMQVLRKAYRRMPTTLAPNLADVLAHLAEGDGSPMLIHCTSGKDRSGFVCAMVLLSLDVPWQTIVNDHMESKRRYPLTKIERALAAALTSRLPPGRMAQLVDLATVHPSYLEASIEEIEHQHGGANNYLKDMAGLTDTRRAALQRRLLISA